jgi:hypothetical protein
MHKENLRQVLPTQWLQPQKVRYKGDAAPDKHSRNQEKTKMQEARRFCLQQQLHLFLQCRFIWNCVIHQVLPFPRPIGHHRQPQVFDSDSY